MNFESVQRWCVLNGRKQSLEEINESSEYGERTRINEMRRDEMKREIAQIFWMEVLYRCQYWTKKSVMLFMAMTKITTTTTTAAANKKLESVCAFCAQS